MGTVRAGLGTVRARRGTVRARLGTVRARLGTVRARLGIVRARQSTVRARLGTVRARLGKVRRKLGHSPCKTSVRRRSVTILRQYENSGKGKQYFPKGLNTVMVVPSPSTLHSALRTTSFP